MPYKQLDNSTKEMFLREIAEMQTKILEKKHEISKSEFTQENIQEGLVLSISQQKHNILSAKERLTDLEFDYQYKVTFNSLRVKITQAEQEIRRLEKNIQARELQIRQGVLQEPTRDEKAREKLREKIKERNEKFTYIGKEKCQELMRDSDFIPATDSWYFNNVMQEGEIGFKILEGGLKERFVVQEDDENVGQHEEEEAGQQESGDKPEA